MNPVVNLAAAGANAGGATLAHGEYLLYSLENPRGGTMTFAFDCAHTRHLIANATSIHAYRWSVGTIQPNLGMNGEFLLDEPSGGNGEFYVLIGVYAPCLHYRLTISRMPGNMVLFARDFVQPAGENDFKHSFLVRS